MMERLDDFVNTPWLLACIDHGENSSVRFIEMLLENGANVNTKIKQTRQTILNSFLGITNADIETCVQIIKFFKNYGYDVNTVSSTGHILLHECVRFSCTDFRKPLTELGVDVNVKDAVCRTTFNNKLCAEKT